MMELRCPQCGTPHGARQSFCGDCGTPLQAGVTRPLPTATSLPSVARVVVDAGGARRGREAAPYRRLATQGVPLLLGLMVIVLGLLWLRAQPGQNALIAKPAPAPAGAAMDAPGAQKPTSQAQPPAAPAANASTAPGGQNPPILGDAAAPPPATPSAMHELLRAQAVELRPGVVITLTNAAISPSDTTTCGSMLRLDWAFALANNSPLPATLVLDKYNMRHRDSTGTDDPLNVNSPCGA